MTRIPIWLSCDPGHDDLFAIILLCAHPKADLLGISSISGNQSLEKTTKNVARSLVLAGHTEIPFYVGATLPLIRASKVCAEIHGEDGLGLAGEPAGTGWAWAEEHLPEAQSGNRIEAMRFAAQNAIDAGHKLTILCTGAQTDAALFLGVYPELAEQVRVVVMGGAIDRGNTGTKSEFNIELDPESAEMVLLRCPDVSYCPLEITHTALATEEVIARVRAIDEKWGVFAEKLLMFFKDSYRTTFFFNDPPVHDPCAALLCLEPELFTTKRYNMHVELAGTRTFGATCFDVYNLFGEAPNCTCAVAMDVPAFWDRMIDAMKAAAEKSAKYMK